jgi:ribosome recycling factor
MPRKMTEEQRKQRSQELKKYWENNRKEALQILKENREGSLKAILCINNGKEYESLTAFAKHFNVNIKTVSYRMRKKKDEIFEVNSDSGVLRCKRIK